MNIADTDAILGQIRDAGVIGAGGAGFPTYKKLASSVDHIIANGAECEPLLQKDRETMLRESDSFLRGLQIMQQLTGASDVTIAVKAKNEDVADQMRPQAESLGFSMFVYPDVYPAGDEYVLVYEITGRLIPPGGIPLAVGCVVDNVETIVNIAHAVDGRSVTRKYVSVVGAVREPITTVVPVGTTLRDCIELAGGSTVDQPAVLTGGVMMGRVAGDLSDPISKSIGGVIVLPADHYLIQRYTASKQTYTRIGHGQCDQCSLCTELCPRYIMGYPIEPHRVMRSLLMTGSDKQRGSLWAQYCCECNVCSLIACPESLDPKNICVDAKGILKEANMGRTEAELTHLFRGPHPARKGREIPIKTLYQRLGLVPYAREPNFVSANGGPQKVSIPLDTHIGTPASPNVREGDVVRCGDLIATVPADQLGCPAHASIDGRVTSVGARTIDITS
jgi:Na+-translocating ferredoxin:NAD+ oxidoreductase RnfC subunit